ncbi:hypothetical protein [Flavobacterium sp.]|uniref:hypothetical protein n=1 Tax=Flavobacterium sp. TaxID=239 RepID=UPI002613807C|nr:hypothetical protein [Flavobacterium sp.]
MQKFLAFLNKYAFVFNSISIVFWLYIIYANYRQIEAENSGDERNKFYIVPILFILLSIFNIYMANKRRKQN